MAGRQHKPPGGAPPPDLADALRMLDRLPLTDVERAAAVRRLLAQPPTRAGGSAAR